MLQADIPAMLRRVDVENGESLTIDITEFALKVWKGFAFGAIRECKSEGLGDVADAVLRRGLLREGDTT